MDLDVLTRLMSQFKPKLARAFLGFISKAHYWVGLQSGLVWSLLLGWRKLRRGAS